MKHRHTNGYTQKPMQGFPKGMDAYEIMFGDNAKGEIGSVVVINNKEHKTAVLFGDDALYLRKRLERVFKDCLTFEDSDKYE